MRKTVLLGGSLLAFIVFCLIAALVVNHLLNLPFRSTNDALHEKKSSFTLDFLIPAGTHIDDKATIREVIRTRTAKETSTYEGMIQAITEMVPNKFLYMAALILYLRGVQPGTAYQPASRRVRLLFHARLVSGQDR